MKNLHSTIDTLAIDIESANNLLLCFEDFCDQMGHLDHKKSIKDLQATSLCFTEQLPRYRTLLYVAENILTKSYQTLEKMSNAIESIDPTSSIF